MAKDKQSQNRETLNAVEKYFKLEVENQKLKSDIEKLRQKHASYAKLLNEKARELEAAHQKLSQFTTSLTESEAKTQQLHDKIADFEAKQQILNYTIIDLERALADSRAQEEISKKELQDVMTTTTQAHSERVNALINESKSLKAVLGQERDKHFAESTHFKNQIATLHKAVSDSQAEVSLLQFKLKEERNKQIHLMKKFDTTLQGERKSWIIEREKIQEAATSAQKELHKINEALKSDMTAEIERLKKSLEQLQGDLTSREERNGTLTQLLEKRNEDYKLKIQETEDRIKSLEDEKSDMAAEIERLNETLEQYQDDLTFRDEQNGTLTQLLEIQDENYKLKIQEAEGRIKSLEDEKSDMAAEILGLGNTLGQLQDSVALVRQDSDMQKCEIAKLKDLNEKMAQDFSLTQQQLTEHNENLESQISTLKDDKLALEAKLSELNQNIAQALDERKAMSDRAIEREKQLEQYYNFVTAEKVKNQKVLKELARQIHYAVTMHPLRDYLLVTEKELSRIESELKKTPIIAPHRPQLEAMVDQLIQQRNYIKDLIEKSERSLSQHTAALERLAGGSLGAGAPPPPPL